MKSIPTNDRVSSAPTEALAQPRASLRRANVLVVYALLNYPLRSAVEDHLYSFGRFSDHRVFYINLAVRDFPKRLRELDFDLVIFHTSLLSTRWTPWLWRRVTARALSLPRRGEVRAAMPQDEFLRAAFVGKFVREAGVDIVFSVAPESEWPKIYPGLAAEGVTFHRVLTGYLDEHTVARIEGLAQIPGERDVTIGYRAWSAPPWLGRHGRLKIDVAGEFRRASAARGLAVDISTSSRDTLLGDDWFRFLGSCRYQLGVEGGASLLDLDGSVMERTEVYVADHSDASFETVEAACFPGRDGEVALFALSPRHLEAGAARTCQILVEGEYNGVLRPGVHYLEVKRDFSNLEQVLDSVERDEKRAELVENAHRDIVGSNHFTYRAFVDEVERLALRPIPARAGGDYDQTWRITTGLDRLSWRDVALRARAIQLGSQSLGPAVRRIRYARRRSASRDWGLAGENASRQTSATNARHSAE